MSIRDQILLWNSASLHITEIRRRRLLPHEQLEYGAPSNLIGALLLLLADMAGRTMFQPLDVPAGVFTAAIGAPFFILLLARHRRHEI